MKKRNIKKSGTNQPRHYRQERKTLLEKIPTYLTILLFLLTCLQTYYLRESNAAANSAVEESQRANDLAAETLKYAQQQEAFNRESQRIKDSIQSIYTDSSMAIMREQAMASLITAKSNSISANLANTALSNQTKQFNLINDPLVIFGHFINPPMLVANTKPQFKFVYKNIGKLPSKVRYQYTRIGYYPSHFTDKDVIDNFHRIMLSKVVPINEEYISENHPLHSLFYATEDITSNLVNDISNERMKFYIYSEISYELPFGGIKQYKIIMHIIFKPFESNMLIMEGYRYVNIESSLI